MAIEHSGSNISVDYRGVHVELEPIVSDEPGVDGYYVIKSGPEFLKEDFYFILNEREVKREIDDHFLYSSLQRLDQEQLHYIGNLLLEEILNAVSAYNKLNHNFSQIHFLTSASSKLPVNLRDQDTDALKKTLFQSITEIRNISDIEDIIGSEFWMKIDYYLSIFDTDI